ncbi:MAG: GNAT family N-acetyltransferase [Syntrophomonadaceae bacterium]|nr:GNAT family N-acetyltransferase [Syntrophomonadaceae bacterium]
MEGRAHNGYSWEHIRSRWQSLKKISRSTLLRLRRLTLKKVLNRLAGLIYKRATLLVISKLLDAPPVVQVPHIPVECKLLNRSNTRQISRLNGMSRERIVEFFTHGGKCLGAFYQGKLVGFSWCHYRDHHFPFFNYCLKVGDGVYIGPDYVVPEFRGCRIHGFLLTKMFAILYAEGCRQVWSSVLKDNYASIKGLKEAGFIPQQQVEVCRVLKTVVFHRRKELSSWP